MVKVLEAYLCGRSFLVHFYQKNNSFGVFFNKFWLLISNCLHFRTRFCGCFRKNYFWIPISWNVLHKFWIFTFFSRISNFTDLIIGPNSVTSFRTSPRDIFGNFTLAILINWNYIDKEVNWTLPLNLLLITMPGFYLIFLSPF